MFEITVGHLKFEASPDNYRSAFVVEPSGLDGWYEGTDTKSETVARPMAHGDFDLPVFRGSRFITIAGNAIADSEYELVHLGRSLTGLIANGESSTLTVADGAGSMCTMVRLFGRPRFSPHPSGFEAEFQVGFKAADPRKYGESHSYFGGAVQAFHYGNFPASPVVEVAGPRSAPYTISGPGGRQFQVTQPLTAGQTHRINFRTGQVFRNGALQTGAIGRADLWAIPPGMPTTAMSISSGSMTVTVPDTYM